MLSEKLKKGISELTFYQRSLLFAELSAIAYLDEKDPSLEGIVRSQLVG